MGDRGRGGVGCTTGERLHADDITVVDVPAKLARRVRLLSTGHGRTSDPADALSVGIAAWSDPALRTVLHAVEIDQAIAALRALTEHRDDLVRTRTQLVNRLHVLVVMLVPTGLARGLTADTAAEALRRIRPRDPLGRTLRALAVDLSPSCAAWIAASRTPRKRSATRSPSAAAPSPGCSASAMS